MPLFGAARISQAIAPRKGGVTKDAVTKARIVWRWGMSVRETSQASGVATAQEAMATLSAMASAVRNGETKLGSLASLTKFPVVRAPLASVMLYQASQRSGSRTSAARSGTERSNLRCADTGARSNARLIASCRRRQQRQPSTIPSEAHQVLALPYLLPNSQLSYPAHGGGGGMGCRELPPP